MIKISFTTLVFILMLALLATGIFLMSKNQLKMMSEISAIFNQKPAVSLTPAINSPGAFSEEQQIAQLRQEIENLKNQQIKQQGVIQTAPKPATSVLIDSKTQEALNNAQAQITSLTQQLVQLQKKSQTATNASTNDADLLRTWQASDKVVQIACQDKFSSSWQLGSGVIISSEGKVLTNQHVVQSSLGLTYPDYCLVLFSQDFNSSTQTYKKQYRASILGVFQDHDAALLKINDVLATDQTGQVQTTPAGGYFPFFQAAPGTPQIGDPVYVIGFPESANFAFSVTKGIISNLTSDGLYFGTDAQIDRGNSGGAALNSDGQLIGLPTYKFVSEGDYRGYILNIQTIKLN